MLPDRWNPRVWLRDWLNRPTASEQARVDALKRSWDEFRDSMLRDSEGRLKEARSLRAQRDAQASTSVIGDV